MNETELIQWANACLAQMPLAASSRVRRMIERIAYLEAETTSLRSRIPALEAALAKYENRRVPLRDKQRHLDAVISGLRHRRAPEHEILPLCEQWNQLEQAAHLIAPDEEAEVAALEQASVTIAENEIQLRVLRKNVILRCKQSLAQARVRARHHEHHRRRAIVAGVEGKARTLADRIRPSLLGYDDCPYCGGPLGNDAHADHIYPISKGGLSIKKNLVLVCRDCNSKKSTLTLAQFIATYRLNRDAIEDRLRRLGKDF